MNNGTVLTITRIDSSTIAQRCAIDHLSNHVCVPAPFVVLAFFLLIMRAASVGVSVKDTRSETAIANEEVNPNDDMNRPTMPAMNPTGRNTASKESVVAVTAMPISRVPSIAAWNGGI